MHFSTFYHIASYHLYSVRSVSIIEFRFDLSWICFYLYLRMDSWLVSRIMAKNFVPHRHLNGKTGRNKLGLRNHWMWKHKLEIYQQLFSQKVKALAEKYNVVQLNSWVSIYAHQHLLSYPLNAPILWRKFEFSKYALVSLPIPIWILSCWGT